MSSFYRCAECDTDQQFPYLASAHPHKGHSARCRRCGAAHFFLAGWAQIVSRPIVPIAVYRELSIWIPAPAQPVIPGAYDVRFSELEPNPVQLHWDGRCFRFNGERVAMATYLGYRGCL